MRVPEKMLFESIVNRMQRQTESVFRLQEQVSSGKKVNRPSDDPIGQSLILNYQKSIASTEQHLRNIDRGNAMLSTGESALQGVEDRLQRARELAVQMANGTYSSLDRATAAKEIREIYDQMVASANTRVEGRYLFAGHQTQTKPFVDRGRYLGTAVTLPVTITTGVNDQLNLTLDGVASTVTLPPGAYATGAALANAVAGAINATPAYQTAGLSASVTFDTDHLVVTSNAIGGTSAVLPTGGSALAGLGLAAGTAQPAASYLGDSGEIPFEIGSGVTVAMNLPGDRLFKGVGVTGGVDIFAAVAGLQVALETNDLAGIGTSLTNLSVAQEQITNERAVLGARLNRIDTAKETLDDFRLMLSKLNSETEDVDLTRAVSDLSLQLTALETSRAVSARLVQRSLLDFLR